MWYRVTMFFLKPWKGIENVNAGWGTMVEFGLEFNGIEEWGLRKEPWCGFILKVFLCSPTTYYRQIGTTITLRPNQEMALSNWKLLRFRALSSANFRAGDVWLLRPIGSWYVTTLQIYKLIILKKIKSGR